MRESVKFPVFRDDKGNRFIFPSIRSDDSTSISWAQCRSICAATGVEEEPERLNLEADEKGKMNFPHIKTEILHPGFAHGAASVYLIGGPTFDEINNSPDS